MTRWNDHASDKTAEALFNRAARAEGLSYHDWCRKYGIVDGSLARQLRRRQVQPPSGIAETTHENPRGMSYGVKGEKWPRITPDAWADEVNNVDDALERSRSHSPRR